MTQNGLFEITWRVINGVSVVSAPSWRRFQVESEFSSYNGMGRVKSYQVFTGIWQQRDLEPGYIS